MSAITGICDLRAICGSASASSCDGTATRTIWQPEAVSSAICCKVAFTSAVTVVVIDCTETGAPPPTGTACFPLPTTIWRDLRRGASGSAGGMGMPRSIVMTVIASLRDVNGIDKVRHDQDQPEPYQQGENSDTHGEQLAHVHQARIRLAAQPGQPGPGPLVDDDGEVAAIQRQQREQVEQADEDIERDDDVQHHRELQLPADVEGEGLAGYLARADDARHLPPGRAGAVLGEQFGDRRGNAAHRLDRAGDELPEL